MERCFAARRLLVSTRRPVLQIGYDCGFGSVSRFYEAFHSMYGQTPRACRTSAEPS
jgi:transcriptional regulator GlxA family with amidase domain